MARIGVSLAQVAVAIRRAKGLVDNALPVSPETRNVPISARIVDRHPARDLA
jgi:hypothetical protein